MKKITLFFMALGFMLSSISLNAQTHFSVSMNGGTVYDSGGGSFCGFPWSGLGNHVFTNTNSSGISIAITNWDEATSGPEVYIRFSRVGFGNAPLGWGSDMSTDLATLTSADFTAGAATVNVDIPAGTEPVTSTAGYMSGYRYILQVVGDNDPEAYINYVSDVQETILSTNDFNRSKLNAFYSADRNAVVLQKNIEGNFKIFNMLGQSVQEGEVSKEINVETLKTGLYILTTDNGTLKFVK